MIHEHTRADHLKTQKYSSQIVQILETAHKSKVHTE